MLFHCCQLSFCANEVQGQVQRVTQVQMWSYTNPVVSYHNLRSAHYSNSEALSGSRILMHLMKHGNQYKNFRVNIFLPIEFLQIIGACNMACTSDGLFWLMVMEHIKFTFLSACTEMISKMPLILICYALLKVLK